MSQLSATIRREVRATFSKALSARAVRLVERSSVGIPESVLCEITRGSEGSLHLLRQDLAMAQIDWRDALMAGMTRRVRQQLSNELRGAGLPVGPARRAVIEALTWTMGIPFDDDELQARVRGRASSQTIRAIVELLSKKRWLRTDDRGRHTLAATKRRGR